MEILVRAINFMTTMVVSFAVYAPLDGLACSGVVRPPVVAATDGRIRDSVGRTASDVVSGLPSCLGSCLVGSKVGRGLVSRGRSGVRDNACSFLTSVSRGGVGPIIAGVVTAICYTVVLAILLVAIGVLTHVFGGYFSVGPVTGLGATLNNLYKLVGNATFILVVYFVV